MKALSKTSINLYFDVASPYSFIGFEALMRYEKHLQIPVKLIPVGLGFILRETGNTVPMHNPQKFKYMFEDLKLVSDYWKIPIKPPADFQLSIVKRGSMPAQRLLTSIKTHCPEYLRPAALEFWHRLWTIDEQIHRKEDIEEVCKKLQISDYEKVIEASNSEEIKNQYKLATDEAIKTGCFGVPWYVLRRDDQQDVRIFGSDRMHIICHLLNKPFVGPLLKNTSSKI